MESIINIEKHIADRANARLKLIPKNISKQLQKIEKMVFHQFKLESHWKYQARLDCFDAVMNSRMTLNELESILKNDGVKLAEKMDFQSALEYITKTVERSKQTNAFKESVKNNKLLNSFIKK